MFFFLISKNFFLFYHFCFFCALTLCFAFKCVTSKNIIEVLFSLVCLFLFSSGCLFCIKIDFISIIFVMVYVGAILVLFLFAIMLLNFREQSFSSGNFILFYSASIFFFLIIYFKMFPYFYEIEYNYFSNLHFKNIDFLYLIDFCIEDISVFKNLYLEYNILLILVALILLIIMVGAISLCLSTKNFLIKKKII